MLADRTPESTIRATPLIALTAAVNALALFFPTIFGDAATYALISKNIALSNDWVNLMFMGADWLDKPHFPFWITALSFRLFGVNGFVYLLPGLLFHSLGAWFTYRLGKHFYDHKTGVLAALLSLTAARLFWSTVDSRAEAYLVGLITGALYFWVLYDEQSKPTQLLGGAAFTAMALMTKGLFVLGAIGGGLLVDRLRRGAWRTPVSTKWILALAVTFLFILPELVALYLQFDRHPEKVVFERTGVSGIRFFFWDSQFGRLFGTGPITGVGKDPFFFIHTFLWAFLPWTLLFFGAVIVFLRRRKQLPDSEVRPFIVLSVSFLIPLIVFSLSRFHLDHYLDIVLPFAAILSARFFLQWLPGLAAFRWICRVQVGMAVMATAAILGMCVVAFRNSGYIWLAALPTAVLVFAALRRADLPASKALVVPVLAVNAIFVVLTVANSAMFVRYDAPYKLARVLDSQPDLVVYDYSSSSKTLGFYVRQRYEKVETLEHLDARGPCDCFIVANDTQREDVLRAFPNAHVVARATGISTNRLALRMMNNTFAYPELETSHLDLIRTGGATLK